MSAPKGALIFVCIVMNASPQDSDSKNTRVTGTCDWCRKDLKDDYPFGASIIGEDYHTVYSQQRLCRHCAITAANALELARQVTELIPKGGKLLYIAIERVEGLADGRRRELLSVKRWSPLEPLALAEPAETGLSTYPLPQD